MEMMFATLGSVGPTLYNVPYKWYSNKWSITSSTFVECFREIGKETWTNPIWTQSAGGGWERTPGSFSGIGSRYSWETRNVNWLTDDLKQDLIYNSVILRFIW
jgi:hypothetical protein